MATNKIYGRGVDLRFPVATTVKSNDPVFVGVLPGVATTDYSTFDGMASIDMEGVFALSVQAVNDSGNSAVLQGDAIFGDGATPPVLSKKASGKLFGYAVPVTPTATLQVIAAGATGTIGVLIAHFPA